MKARDIMTSNPACVTPETSLQNAARLMEQHDCGALPVVEEGTQRLLGVVTDRDITIRAVASGKPADTLVREVMSSRPRSCKVDSSLDDVERMMAEEQIRRVPIVDEQNRVVGVVAQADLARQRQAVGERDFAEVIERISEPAEVVK